MTLKTFFIFTLISLFAIKSKAQSASTPFKSAVSRGKQVYIQNCLSCHQEDGSGVSRLNPPLTKTSFVLGDQSKLIKIILKGLEEEIEINGEYYSNPMPAFEGTLKDQEIADVLTYIRNNFGNKAVMVPVAKVKEVRSAIK